MPPRNVKKHSNFFAKFGVEVPKSVSKFCSKLEAERFSVERALHVVVRHKYEGSCKV